MGTGFEHREYIGTILPPFDLERKRQTKNGWYIDFTIETASGVLPCRAFEEVVEAAAAAFEAGKKVALFGYLHGEQLRVKSARSPEKPATKKHIAFNGETPADVQKRLDDTRKSMERKGFVGVTDRGQLKWYPQSYCLQLDGKWTLKIEWLMDRLGTKYVADKLRAERFVQLEKDKVALARGFERLYLQIIDEMVKEAAACEQLDF